MKCVVLCAGKGTRFGRHGSKSVTDVEGQALIHHVLDYWKKYFDEFVVIINENGQDLVNYISKTGFKVDFVVQKEINGIAGAIKQVQHMVGDRFAVVLGDCFFSGDFEPETLNEVGFGMIKSDQETISKNFSVEIEGGYAKKLIEKPQNPETEFCGTGFYIFDSSVFQHIDEFMKMDRKEYDITAVMQMMINNGIKLKPYVLNGNYINMNYPEDLEKIKTIIRRLKNK